MLRSSAFLASALGALMLACAWLGASAASAAAGEEVSVSVTVPGVSTTRDPLATTGAGMTELVIAGIIAVGVGVVVVLAARRRDAARAAGQGAERFAGTGYRQG